MYRYLTYEIDKHQSSPTLRAEFPAWLDEADADTDTTVVVDLQSGYRYFQGAWRAVDTAGEPEPEVTTRALLGRIDGLENRAGELVAEMRALTLEMARLVVATPLQLPLQAGGEPELAKPRAARTTARLNVRAGRSAKAKLLRTLGTNAPVQVYGEAVAGDGQLWVRVHPELEEWLAEGWLEYE